MKNKSSASAAPVRTARGLAWILHVHTQPHAGTQDYQFVLFLRLSSGQCSICACAQVCESIAFMLHDTPLTHTMVLWEVQVQVHEGDMHEC